MDSLISKNNISNKLFAINMQCINQTNTEFNVYMTINPNIRYKCLLLRCSDFRIEI